MKTQTKVLDLQKLLAVNETEKNAIAARQKAQRELDDVIKGLQTPALIDPVTLSRARQSDSLHNQAVAAFDALPKTRRELAERTHKSAIDIAVEAARRMGGDYSGTVKHAARFSDVATAHTVTDSGEQYSRSCKYRKTDAQHTVKLDAARVHTLVAAERLRELSKRDGLPLIALDDDGACVWVVAKGKQIASEAGWIVGCDRCCYHSTKSRDDAVKGHAKKLAALLKAEQEQAARERARKASPEYKAERRARLIARLCGNVTATVADAKACGYCTPGIEQFQRQHGIGDTATLPQLVKTDNGLAISLALKLARKIAKAA